MLIKLENGGDDYFIGFNRAIGINVDQREAPDQVTVTQSAGGSSRSFLRAKLGAGEAFAISNINSSGSSALIEVVSIDLGTIPAVAQVKVSNTGSRSGEETTVRGPLELLRALCFSKVNQVTVRGKGQISMDQLEVGDYVLSSNGFSKVWGFHHLHANASTNFLRIEYQDQDRSGALEVSSEHILFCNGKAVAAGDVVVGRTLEGHDGKLLEIIRIETVRRTGVYAPATESGEIVVSGVRASNYVQLLSLSVFSHHTMAHTLLAPKRWMCLMIPSKCTDEEYTSEGYSYWAKFFIDLSIRLKRGGLVVEFVGSLCVAPVIVIVYLLDFFAAICGGGNCCLAVCLFATAIARKCWAPVSTSSKEVFHRIGVKNVTL